MAERIIHLYDSPCFKCTRSCECDNKIVREPCLKEVVDYVFPRKGYSYKQCSIFNAIMLERKYKI